MTEDRHGRATNRRPGCGQNQIRRWLRAAQDLLDRPRPVILEGDNRLSCGPAPEALPHLAVLRPFGVVPGAIPGYHMAPECHRAGMAQILDDFPFAGESIKNQS